MPQLLRDSHAKPRDTSELPKITGKQHRFIELLVAEGLPAAEAYRQAYNTQARSANVSAAQLRRLPGVAAWIDAYREIALDRVELGVESYVRHQSRLAHKAEERGSLAVASQCWERAAKALGVDAPRQSDDSAASERSRRLTLLASLESLPAPLRAYLTHEAGMLTHEPMVEAELIESLPKRDTDDVQATADSEEHHATH